MRTETTQLIQPLTLYNILEAFLAGTTESFLVLDQHKEIILFNQRFEDFIRCATNKQIVRSLPFLPFLHASEKLTTLRCSIEEAFEKGETCKFSFEISCGTDRWYDVELHPLKQDGLVIGLGVGLFETTDKRLAEEAVKKSEALFKALVQNSSDIFILLDKQLIVRYVSEAFKIISGFEPEVLAGQSAFGLFHPDEQETVAAWLAQLIEDRAIPPVLEFRGKTQEGEWRYLEASGKNLLADEQVASLVINIRDIHAKELADQALVNAEQRVTLLLNNTKESFIILNNRLRVTAYNQAAQEHSPHFFITELRSDLSLLDLVHPTEAEVYLEIMDEVLQGHEKEYETTTLDEQGKMHIYRHNFRKLHTNEGINIFITSADITDKRLALLALQENEEKFKTIIEYSFDAIVIIDENADITYVSPSISHLLGFEPEELLGKNGFDYIFHEDIPQVRQKLASIISDEDETFADYRSITKSGELKWLEAKGKNMFANHHIRGILVSLRDISERKKLLEEQTKLAHELSKYNKDLQQFSFITSHNLRAPVANLMSLLSLYNYSDPGDSFNLELMQKFTECTDKLNETLNDLINVLVIRSKPNADQEHVRFADIAFNVQENVQALLNAVNGKIHYDFSAAAGIEYNKLHLESIFLNLVTNSIKYFSVDRQLQIHIRSSIDSNGVVLSFADNGSGIDLNRYGNRMFGLYQRFNAAREGKGLGLYMVKSQITAAGGDIEVQSEPGIGTTFTVHFNRLPR